MKFNVETELEYDVNPDCTLILSICALDSKGQKILREALYSEPRLFAEEMGGTFQESRLIRIDSTETTHLKISYTAEVETAFDFVSRDDLNVVPVSKLDAETITYLYPSRYCQSDKLYRFANNKFGNMENGFEQVYAVTDWIYRNVEYLSGSTNSQTSAFDTITELSGVCRDFAHLGIALCRALTIPARYFTGYSFKLKPADFHACFEAYLGGRWVLFDATHLAPLNGLVKIASGRDAADAALANIFGEVYFTKMTVKVENESPDFEPFFYQPYATHGIVHL